MHKDDRETMIKELITLGLHKELLDGLGDSIIQRLFDLIGWAAPAFIERNKNGRKRNEN
jgi:hypothetical protein